MRTEVTVLVITSADDDTAARVEDVLHERSCDVLRVDPGVFSSSPSFSIGGTARHWTGHIETVDRLVPVSGIVAVYYRRPSVSSVPDQSSEQVQRFVREEVRQAWSGLRSVLTVRFVNRPGRVLEAEPKLAQLAVAERLGFRVPRTLLTTSAADARAFVREAAQVVYKPFKAPFLHDGTDARLTYATIVGPEDLDDESVALAPCQFQEFVPKRHDVRLMAVGPRCLAAAILAGSDRAYVDWRADYASLRYAVVEPPDRIKRLVSDYLAHFGLLFGCFDFAVGPGPDGPETWWFLECGPNAQWGWIEHETGLPIAAALADLLTGRAA